MLQCFNSVSNNETNDTPKYIVFCPTAINKLLTYAYVLRSYGATMFVDVRLARLTSHAAIGHCREKCQIVWGFFATNIISFY